MAHAHKQGVAPVQWSADPWRKQTVLSLDGGGTRGYASLLLLRVVMARVSELEDFYNSRTDEERDQILRSQDPFHNAPPINDHDFEFYRWRREHALPCHYFTLIGGTSTGGLQAMLLGRLRVSVDTALDSYLTLTDEVFGYRNERLFHIKSKLNSLFLGSKRSKYSLQRLQYHFEQLVYSIKGPPEDSTPHYFEFDRVRLGQCRTVVFAHSPPLKPHTSKPSLGTNIHALRTYRHDVHYHNNEWVRRSPEHNCSGTEEDLTGSNSYPLWIVACAATCAQTYFDVLTHNGRMYRDPGIHEVNNPIQTIWNEMKILEYGLRAPNDADTPRKKRKVRVDEQQVGHINEKAKGAIVDCTEVHEHAEGSGDVNADGGIEDPIDIEDKTKPVLRDYSNIVGFVLSIGTGYKEETTLDNVVNALTWATSLIGQLRYSATNTERAHRDFLSIADAAGFEDQYARLNVTKDLGNLDTDAWETNRKWVSNFASRWHREPKWLTGGVDPNWRIKHPKKSMDANLPQQNGTTNGSAPMLEADRRPEFETINQMEEFVRNYLDDPKPKPSPRRGNVRQEREHPMQDIDRCAKMLVQLRHQREVSDPKRWKVFLASDAPVTESEQESPVTPTYKRIGTWQTIGNKTKRMFSWPRNSPAPTKTTGNSPNKRAGSEPIAESSSQGAVRELINGPSSSALDILLSSQTSTGSALSPSSAAGGSSRTSRKGSPAL